MLCTIRLTRAAAFGLMAVALQMLLVTSTGPAPLTDGRLRHVVGTNKQFHVQKFIACSDRAAIGQFVSWDNCTAGNSGANPASCVQCNGDEWTHMEVQQGSDGGPGVKFAQTLSCGRLFLGTCKMVNRVPSCADQFDAGTDCLSASEYHNQP